SPTPASCTPARERCAAADIASAAAPVVVYKEDNGIVKAFRNLPGVELVNVRMAISAFRHLDRGCLCASRRAVRDLQQGVHAQGLPPVPCQISNRDVTRLSNSDESSERRWPEVLEAPLTAQASSKDERGLAFF
ncbi:hypothetical protein DFH06DRAFT_1154217, partial [Mycena polygramma]